MATSEHFTYGIYGDQHDALLEKISIELGCMTFDDDLANLTAGLLMLDEALGKDKPENIICMSPGYAGWLTMYGSLLNDDIVKLAEALEEDEDSPALAEFNRQLSAGFRFKFGWRNPSDFDSVEQMAEANAALPKALREREFTMRVYTDEQYTNANEGLPAVFTATPEGKVIELYERTV